MFSLILPSVAFDVVASRKSKKNEPALQPSRPAGQPRQTARIDVSTKPWQECRHNAAALGTVREASKGAVVITSTAITTSSGPKGGQQGMITQKSTEEISSWQEWAENFRTSGWKIGPFLEHTTHKSPNGSDTHAHKELHGQNGTESIFSHKTNCPTTQPNDSARDLNESI